MKSLARSFVWWAGLDKALEAKVKACDQCQHSQHLPAMDPIQPWEWPERPWSRLHVDYAGPLRGHMFLVVVDAYSKWMEVRPVKSATSAATISQLRAIFATHGIPELLVSDNGSAFTSSEFEEFMRLNRIRHTTSAPYHPATNGLAERVVQTFKTYLKKAPSLPLKDLISWFLLTYRITPHSTTGTSPAELLFSRRPRTLLDLVLPDLSSRVHANQHRQKTNILNTGSFAMEMPSLSVTSHPKRTGYLEQLSFSWVSILSYSPTRWSNCEKTCGSFNHSHQDRLKPIQKQSLVCT